MGDKYSFSLYICAKSIIMKKSILFLFLAASTVSLFSQSITVTPHEYNVNDSNTTSVVDLGTDITVQNVSANTINIRVSREVLSATPGTENYFCWVGCYLAGTSTSPDQVSFAPGHIESNKFQVHFRDNGIELASASIRYCAFNSADISDSACAIVNYAKGTVSTNTLEKVSTFSDFHPNPTSSYANLDYSILPSQTAEIVVTDMLGTVVKKKTIQNTNGIVRLDVNNTPNGLYFANIYVDGKLNAIKRLLVSK